MQDYQSQPHDDLDELEADYVVLQDDLGDREAIVLAEFEQAGEKVHHAILLQKKQVVSGTFHLFCIFWLLDSDRSAKQFTAFTVAQPFSQ